MLIIELQFPGGRYHATPWGRNVNEGEAEWPPSPFRLARAIIDVWKRKNKDWPETRLISILKALSPPARFLLPHTAFAHTRSYLSSNERDFLKKQLIFDPFIAIERNEKILMGFDSNLTGESSQDLSDLLTELNYFGRSESWVSAKVAGETPNIEWNCIPVSSETSDKKGKIVRVACLRSPEDYDRLSHRPSCGWLEAVYLTTKDLLEEGWSDPPALEWKNYLMHSHPSKILSRKRPFQARFRCAKYALSSRVLPRVQDTASFAERIRGHLMGIHKKIKNQDPRLVSPIFSGKDADGNPLKGHKHAFFLPLDEDCDGRLDHLLVYSGEHFDESELLALDRLRSVWQPNRLPDVNLILINLSADCQGEVSRQWVSATPFITARHYRKGRGAFEEWLTNEIKKECSFHDLPEPAEVEWIPHTMHGPHAVHWFEFIRGHKETMPPHGYGCVITFDKAIKGPFSIGSGCHFGLGLFIPHHEFPARTLSEQKSLEGSRLN
jgi:CRISPR-associated protein Csb2